MHRTPSVSNATRYWADSEPDKIGAAVRDRFRRYQARCRDSGRLEVWKIADVCYHGRNPDGGYSNAQVITFGGDQGEIAQIHVGHFRRHVKGQVGIATRDRPALEITQTTNDAEATSAVQIARQVLEYDLDAGELERELAAAHLRAVLYSEGYIVQTWDFSAGEVVGTEALGTDRLEADEPGIPARDEEDAEEPLEVEIHEGAVRTITRSPFEVARDLDVDTVDEIPWYIVRTRAHRWELAAEYPDDADKRRVILDAPRADADGEDDLWTRHRTSGRGSDGYSDYVSVLTLYHPPSSALPEGRLTTVVGEDVLTDVPYPYDHMVVHRDLPDAEVDRVVGYSDAWDLLALSQALDSVESSILTVHDAGGVINWMVPRQSNVKPVDLQPGLTMLEYSTEDGGSAPELMPRPENRETDFKLSEHYQTHMQTLSGQNATVQGDPGKNINAGNYAALVASMAVQAVTAQVQGYAALFRSVLTARLKLYQRFAKTERLIEKVGKDQQGHVRSFSGDQLRGVRRVKIEMGSPISRTLPGKMDIAERLLSNYGPEAVTIDKFFTLIQTGRLDDIDPGASAKHLVVARKENDMFREGEGERVAALVSDNHEVHISEHLDDVNDESVRFAEGPDLQGLAQRLAHITDHFAQWELASPAMLVATGQRPAPIAQPPLGPPPPGPGGGPPPPEAPPMPPAPGPSALPLDAMGQPPALPEVPTQPDGSEAEI